MSLGCGFGIRFWSLFSEDGFEGYFFGDISGGVLKDISLVWFQGMLLWVVFLNDTSLGDVSGEWETLLF